MGNVAGFMSGSGSFAGGSDPARDSILPLPPLGPPVSPVICLPGIAYNLFTAGQ